MLRQKNRLERVYGIEKHEQSGKRATLYRHETECICTEVHLRRRTAYRSSRNDNGPGANLTRVAAETWVDSLT